MILAYRVVCRGEDGTESHILPRFFIRDYAAHVADPDNPAKWAGSYPSVDPDEDCPVRLDLRRVVNIRLFGTDAD